MSIIHYVSLHVESARTALKQLLRQPVGTLLTLLMLAVAMTLPLFMYLGIQSGQSVLGKLNESPQITLYMETDASKADSDTVRNLLERDARLNKIRFISKQEGLEELQSNLDRAYALDIMELFKTFHEAGTTVIVAAHDETLMADYGHRILRLSKGRLA